MSEKLFVVVRADLPVGLQLAQAVHAALTAADKTGTVAEFEAVIAAPVAILHVPDVAALEAVFLRARDRGVGDVVGESIAVLWLEPDLDGEATAAAFFGHGAAGAVRALPLAFRSSP
jgi:hypothetical protein